MRKYILICIGGMLGAMSRYLIKGINIYPYYEGLPLNTLITNVSGSFALALILTIAFEVWEFDANIRIGITTGFLGAYTTFSTLCKESVGLMKEGLYVTAISYITLSTMFGIIAAYLGKILVRKVIAKLVIRDNDKAEESTINKIESNDKIGENTGDKIEDNDKTEEFAIDRIESEAE